MGNKAFTSFLISTQGHIDTLNTVGVLEKRVTALTARSEGGGPDVEQAARELVETTRAEQGTNGDRFFVKMKKQWTKPKDQVIGHVVWAPPVERCFYRSSQLYEGCLRRQARREEVLAEFQEERGSMLLGVRIITHTQQHRPQVRMRYVIKRSLTTLTTIGCLTGYESHVRPYFALGQWKQQSTPMTTTLVHSPGAGTLGPSSPTPSASSLPSEPVHWRTKCDVCQCTGSGRSSRPSSPVPTSTSKTTTTRFVELWSVGYVLFEEG